MTYTTLISSTELAQNLYKPDWAIFDCRYSLADAGSGRLDYIRAHIPGAQYVHLDEDLAGLKIPGVTGRHPLASIETSVENFSKWGIDSKVQVIAYDDSGGALAAVRLWWMLRWLGHSAVAVLDGGWQSWAAEGRRVCNGSEYSERRVFIANPHPEMIVDAGQVAAMRLDPTYRIIDTRIAERFYGEVETIDPVAGHIPGAINAPYINNLTAEGSFRPVEELRRYYQELIGDIPAERVVFYCGSGITAIHNLLAMQHLGLGEARLYVGSWSEWITDPERPVA